MTTNTEKIQPENFHDDIKKEIQYIKSLNDLSDTLHRLLVCNMCGKVDEVEFNINYCPFCGACLHCQQ